MNTAIVKGGGGDNIEFSKRGGGEAGGIQLLEFVDEATVYVWCIGMDNSV